MRYGLDDKPSFPQLLVYGLQWLVVALPSVIIVGLVISKLHGHGAADQILYLQKLFGIVGVFTVVQVLWGHRLPLIIGPASVLLVGIVSAQAANSAAIYTAVFWGGALLAVISFSGLLSRMQKLFTPAVVSVILILIALTLTPVILNMIFGRGEAPLFHLLFALSVVFLMLIGNMIAKGVWRSTVLLFAIVLGSVCYYLFMGFPDVASVAASSSATEPLILLPIHFDIGVIVSFFFCYVALTINELGSIQSVGYLLNAPEMDKRITKGCAYSGVSNMFSGLFGVVGTVDFSMTPGVIAATGCASRYAMVPMGVMMAAIACIPFLVKALLLLPSAVMGAIFFYLMATQLGAGLQMLVSERAVTEYNSSVTVALPLMVALVVIFMPDSVTNAIPVFLRPILGNGFVMGVVTVFFLEHMVFRKKKKREQK